MIFKSIEAFEDTIMKVLFPHFVPDVFDGIEFRRIGRLLDHTEVGWLGEPFVPPGPIHDHYYPILGMSGGHLVEKKLHAVCVDAR